jgi:hypothetical protein
MIACTMSPMIRRLLIPTKTRLRKLHGFLDEVISSNGGRPAALSLRRRHLRLLYNAPSIGWIIRQAHRRTGRISGLFFTPLFSPCLWA